MATWEVKYGGARFLMWQMAMECAPEVFGSEDEVVFIRETYVFTGLLIEFGQDGPQTHFKAAWDRARSTLMERGLNLTITAADQVLLAHTRARDFDGGPTPKSVKITEITGGLAARVAWTVEIARRLDAGNPVSNMGWRVHSYIETVQVDDRMLATRSIRGTVRRAPGQKAVNDAVFVENAHPRLAGFKRERKWNAVRDGCQLDYELVDKELYLAFPKPVTNGKATFQIGRKDTGDDGWKSIKHLSATYEAPKGVAKRKLAGMLIQLAVTRFALFSQVWLISQFAFTEDIFGGALSLEITAEGDGISQAQWDREVDRTLGARVINSGGEMQDAGPFGTSDTRPLRRDKGGRFGPVLTGGGESGSGRSGDVVGGRTGKGGRKFDPVLDLPFIGPRVVPGILPGVVPGGILPGLVPGGIIAGMPMMFGESVMPAELRVIRCYETQRHLVTLRPKSAGAAVITQETAPETRTITEFGVARFIDRVPTPAQVPEGMTESARRVLQGLPQEDAAGQTICPVRWMRRIIVG